MAEFIIHRGSHQIGGMCAEIRTEKSRIIIDFGANLPDTDEEQSVSDDELYERVFGDEKKPDAILFTHYHGDHTGLVERIPDDIPLYIGRTAKKICLNLHRRTDRVNQTDVSSAIEGMKTYRPGTPFRIGDISIRPFQIGHSALDSYMFLICVDKKKILYTGDFRDHGIICSRVTFEEMIKKHVKKIDILITEGTMFARPRSEIMSEYELCDKAREIFKRHKYNFVLVSSTNLDSIMSFYHATPAGKAFICDKYQLSQILTACNDFGTKKHGMYKRYNTVSTRPITDMDESDFDIEKYREKGFVMLVRTSDKFRPYPDMFESGESCIIYSMWNGYLKGGRKENSTIVDFLDGRDIKKIHTSGHASVECIQRLIELTCSERIIPVHSECSDEMGEIREFEKYRNIITPVSDGEPVTI